jgi:hypothetical protein
MVRQWTPFVEKCPLFFAFHDFSAKRVAPPPSEHAFLSLYLYIQERNDFLRASQEIC